MRSAFGVDHGVISKAAPEKAAKVALKFKPIPKGTKPTGPGSERAKLSPRAWETQTAAARRSK